MNGSKDGRGWLHAKDYDCAAKAGIFKALGNPAPSGHKRSQEWSVAIYRAGVGPTGVSPAATSALLD